MTATLSGLAVLLLLLLVALLILGWRLSRLAARVARVEHRVERSWRVLDSALERRARRALQESCRPTVDAATTLLVGGAAAATLERGLSWSAREEVESRLTQVLGLARLPGLGPEQERAALARRLHNDAVAVARALRGRRSVRALRLAGRAGEPRTFEMADGQELVWSGGVQR